MAENTSWFSPDGSWYRGVTEPEIRVLKRFYRGETETLARFESAFQESLARHRETVQGAWWRFAPNESFSFRPGQVGTGHPGYAAIDGKWSERDGRVFIHGVWNLASGEQSTVDGLVYPKTGQLWIDCLFASLYRNSQEVFRLVAEIRPAAGVFPAD